MIYLTKKIYLSIISVIFLSYSSLSAGELADLRELNKLAQQELIALKATGIGDHHPHIAAKEKQILELENKISDLRDVHEEVVILLRGTSSFHMKGHAKFEKTDKALPSLLLQGWKIKSITPLDGEASYVWLTRGS